MCDLKIGKSNWKWYQCVKLSKRFAHANLTLTILFYSVKLKFDIKSLCSHGLTLIIMPTSANFISCESKGQPFHGSCTKRERQKRDRNNRPSCQVSGRQVTKAMTTDCDDGENDTNKEIALLKRSFASAGIIGLVRQSSKFAIATSKTDSLSMFKWELELYINTLFQWCKVEG